MLGSRKPKPSVRPKVKAAPPPKRPNTLREKRNGPRATVSGSWLDNLKIGQKLTLIAGGFLIPLAILVGLFIINQNTQIAFSAKEQLGTRYLKPVVELLQDVQKHRGLMNQLLRGNAAVQPDIDKVRQAIQGNLQAIKSVDQAIGSELGTTALVGKLEENLASLLQYDQSVAAETSWNAHTLFIQNHIVKLIFQVGNASNLILDPDLDTYWSMNNVIITLPKLAEAIGQVRGYGSGILSAKTASRDQLATLATNKSNMLQLLSETEQSVNFILDANPSLRATIGAGFNSLGGPIYGFKQIVETHLLGPSITDYSPKDYFGSGTLALDKTYSFYDITLSELDRLIGVRVQKLQRAMWTELAVVALVLIIALFLVVSIVGRITRPLGQLETAAGQLAKGDLSFELKSSASDEIGQLTQSFQAAAQQLKVFLGQQQAERERGQKLQDNVGRFLNVATEIAQGDLTKRGEVTEDALGNVVDAINLMTEEMAYLLKDVQKAALSVNLSAGQMDSLNDSIASGAQTQAGEVIQVRERTQQAAGAMRQMAERAGGSVKQARQTLEAAQAGRTAVSATLSGMSDIRIEIQGIAEQVRALSTRSAEIENIAKTLEDFASQTNLLALNASFEAAGAGTVGRRFAVIADEIRQLAESSARETGRVGALVQEVQSDIRGVVAMAQDGVRQVESGYEVANTAGERLEEISRLAEQAAQVAEQISALAQTQVSEVERVDQAVQNIAQTAASTEQESLQGRQAAQDMRQLAEDLSTNLSRFRLPS